MPDEFSSLPVKKTWFKTAKGIVLLIFLSFLALGIISFSGLFIYYAWQIKYGDEGKLVEQFKNEKFTSVGILAENNQAQVEDVSKYVRVFNPVFGKKDSKITILMFIDFQCPFSREAHLGFKAVMEKYASVVKVVFKQLPLTELHPQASAAVEASACAAEQNKFWEYYNQLFADQKLDQAGFLASARAVVVDVKKFQTCLEQNKYQTQIEQDMLDAVELGVRGTPTYFVNGLKVEGAISAEDWDKIILGFLK